MAEEGRQPEEVDGDEARHVIRMIAGISLIWTNRGWVVEEDPVARLDRDDDLVCTEEGHVLSGVQKARCELLKERGRAAPLPSPQLIADAFQRSAARRIETV